MSRRELPDWIDRAKLNLVYNKQEMVEKYVEGGDSYVLHVRNTLATKGIEMTPKEIKDIADELIMYYYSNKIVLFREASTELGAFFIAGSKRLTLAEWPTI